MKRCTLLFVVLSLLAFAVFAEEPKRPMVLARNDPGVCINDCSNEHGICVGSCAGNGACISNCSSAYSRCVARCHR